MRAGVTEAPGQGRETPARGFAWDFAPATCFGVGSVFASEIQGGQRPSDHRGTAGDVASEGVRTAARPAKTVAVEGHAPVARTASFQYSAGLPVPVPGRLRHGQGVAATAPGSGGGHPPANLSVAHVPLRTPKTETPVVVRTRA